MRSQIQHEKETISLMIGLYCRKKHQTNVLCLDCKELLNYTFFKIENCIFGEEKPTCKSCSVHCYQKIQREKVREIMRFAGPRMIWFYPIRALMHFFRIKNTETRSQKPDGC
ncbi:MAG: nitrous oxide-stimulated promoter family protein [Bacteroidota bacterium]